MVGAIILSAVILSGILLIVVMPSYVLLRCHYALCHYVWCCNAKWRSANCLMPSFVIMVGFLLNVVLA